MQPAGRGARCHKARAGRSTRSWRRGAQHTANRSLRGRRKYNSGLSIYRPTAARLPAPLRSALRRKSAPSHARSEAWCRCIGSTGGRRLGRAAKMKALEQRHMAGQRAAGEERRGPTALLQRRISAAIKRVPSAAAPGVMVRHSTRAGGIIDCHTKLVPHNAPVSIGACAAGVRDITYRRCASASTRTTEATARYPTPRHARALVSCRRCIADGSARCMHGAWLIVAVPLQ